jgi:hypothetical protein
MDSWPPKMPEKEKRIFDRMMIRKAKEQFRAGGWSCRATRKRFEVCYYKNPPFFLHYIQALSTHPSALVIPRKTFITFTEHLLNFMEVL